MTFSVSTYTLQQKCDEVNSDSHSACMYFIVAVLDYYEILELDNTGRGGLRREICVDAKKESKSEHLVQVVKDYLDRPRFALPRLATTAVVQILREAFPCGDDEHGGARCFDGGTTEVPCPIPEGPPILIPSGP